MILGRLVERQNFSNFALLDFEILKVGQKYINPMQNEYQ
jgi:hypothetical protein